MATVSTHVLDTSLGAPAAGVGVTLSRRGDGTALDQGVTDPDGRIPVIGPDRLEPGDYVLRFDTAAYFSAAGRTAFYPEVAVVFTIAPGEEHYHVPVLLNPFGYSTYRGS